MQKQNKKKKEEFPGYPHYPSSHDITKNEQRADGDVEDLPRSAGRKESKLKTPPVKIVLDDATPEIVPGTEADITDEDLQILGDKDRDPDGGEDETLLPLVELGPDLSGDDLDVPGAELDDDAENSGSEDEENNYYSRGQD